MFVHGTQILQWLVLLAVCHGLAVDRITSHYYLVRRPMSWVKAREFCQRHYVDLAVLSTEEQYFTLLNATPASNASFWLGLQRQSVSSVWKWVNGENLGYEHRHNRNYEGCCGSLEKDTKLLGRHCGEQHMIVCQGPVSPQSVAVGSVGANHVNLSWNVSAFMQMTPHSYNVKICSSTCKTLPYSYTDGSALMNINISDLTSATEYRVEVSAFVVRPDRVTGKNTTLQNNPTTLQVKTADCCQPQKIIMTALKLFTLGSLVPLLWVLYHVLKKDDFIEADDDVSPMDLSAEATVVDLIPQRNRVFG